MTAATLRARLADVEQKLSNAQPFTSGDPALARLGAAALRQHHKRTDAALDRYTRLVALRDRLRFQLASAEGREAEAARARLTADDVRGASLVRDKRGWHKVVRVNATSVTVETGYSWTDRIPLHHVIEVSS